MKRTSFVFCIAALLVSQVKAEIISPNEEISAGCGPKIKASEVMTLDLEPFGNNTEGALVFVSKHAGDYVIFSPAPELIETKWQHVKYDRESGIKRAIKEAAKRGCDLLLVLNAGINIVGQANFSQGRATANAYSSGSNSYGNASGYSSGASRNINKGQAYVLMGDRKN